MERGISDVIALRKLIDKYLKEKGWSFKVDKDGAFVLSQGSTYVIIEAKKWGQNTVVTINAPVALDIKKISLELTRGLLVKNFDLILGKFSLDRNGKAIYYENALLGNDLDPDELYSAVESAALIADEYDDRISVMAGGKRAIDG